MAFKGTLCSVLFLLLPFIGWGQSRAKMVQPDSIFQQADSLRRAARYAASNQAYKKFVALHQNDRRVIDALINISRNKLVQGNIDSSSAYLGDAVALFKQHNRADTLFLVKEWYQKGRIAAARADYDSALIWYEQALTKAEQIDNARWLVRCLTSLGDLYDAKAEYDEAIEWLSKAEQQYHKSKLTYRSILSTIYNNYGIVYQHKGMPDRALGYYKKSLSIDRAILTEQHPSIAKTSNNIAILYYYESDYQRALEYMKNAASVLADFHGEKHRLVAAGYNNIGIVYSEMGDLDLAAKYLEKALAIKVTVLGNQHPEVVIGYQNIGAIYYDMEQYDQAIDYYKQSEALHLKQFPDGHPELANVYANLGQAYFKKKEYRKALAYYEKDLNINLKELANNHPFIGDTFTKMGETYAMVGNPKVALDYYQRALATFVKGFNKESGPRNPSLDQVVYPYKLLTTLRLKAEALHDLAIQSGDRAGLEYSLQTSLRAVELIDKLQHAYQREESKFVLRERTTGIFNRGFETAYALLQQTGHPDYKEYAFYFVEKSKNQILIDQIQNLKAQRFGLPDSVVAYEQSIRTEITALQQQLSTQENTAAQSDSLREVTLRDSLFHTQKKLQRYVHQLEENYPKYHRLKYKEPVMRIEDIQQDILSPNQTMITYFFGEESLFALTLSRAAFNIRKISSDSLIKEHISSYQGFISNAGTPAIFAKRSHNLYETLITPIADLIDGKDLLIIPDGPLHYFPFESLVQKALRKDENVRFNDLPYLIEKFTISYVPSADYLSMHRAYSKEDRIDKLLAFAPVFNGMNSSEKRSQYPDFERPLSALPLSKREVSRVGKLFEGSSGFWSLFKRDKSQADIFIEEKATESTFKKLSLEGYEYIHLATHAFVSDKQTGRSGILFTSSEDQDGVLYASEIYDLKLNAQLVTLSACNTGGGVFARGEGILSLSRAFQYAGARNLLVSLWNVDDRSTEKLVVDFYRANKDRQKMPEALRYAKLKAIDEGRYAHPKYWSSFVFIGH